MKEKIIAKIKEANVPDEYAEELYELISDQVLQTVFQDYTTKHSDEEIQATAERMENAKSTEHLETIINDIAVMTYNDNVPQQIENIYLDILDALKEQIDTTRELLLKAQDGDPEALKTIQDAQNTEEYKQIMGDQNEPESNDYTSEQPSIQPQEQIEINQTNDNIQIQQKEESFQTQPTPIPEDTTFPQTETISTNSTTTVTDDSFLQSPQQTFH